MRVREQLITSIGKDEAEARTCDFPQPHDTGPVATLGPDEPRPRSNL